MDRTDVRATQDHHTAAWRLTHDKDGNLINEAILMGIIAQLLAEVSWCADQLERG